MLSFQNLWQIKSRDRVDLINVFWWTAHLHLDKNKDSIILKKPNQVYFELYKEAIKKAKQAKKNAILAYLEAKNIKKTYMLECLIDSDSDFDAEIDEVSESELEGV